jgi:hypothetical protein
MTTKIFRKINLPLLGRGLGGGLLLLIALPAHAQTPNLSLCEGQSFMLISSADGPDALGPITYTWYDVTDPATSFTVGTNAATLTMPASSVTAGIYTYMCKVANSACTLSSSTYSVEVAAVLVISITGGAANQTAYLNVTMPTVTYSAPGATLTLSSGSLPPGITGTASANAYTAGGVPEDIDTYNYTLTAANSAGCTATFSDAITVLETPPPPEGACSENLWLFGSQLWTDRICVAPDECTESYDLDGWRPMPPQYTGRDNGVYYYNWVCALVAKETLCPSPWRVPTYGDITLLASHIIDPAVLISEWGTQGWINGQSIEHEGFVGEIWTTDTQFPYDISDINWVLDAYVLMWDPDIFELDPKNTHHGRTVRCVLAPAPIAHVAGPASQAATQCAAITPVTYSAPNATFSATGLPPGVTYTAAGASVIISGTPTAAGIYNYTVTATLASGETSSLSGEITVTAPAAPPGAQSDQVWCIGTQIWSDALKAAPAGFTETTSLGIVNPPPDPLYRTAGLQAGSGYLYYEKCEIEL